MAFYKCGNCGMPFQTTDDAVSVNCPRCGAYQILRDSGDPAARETSGRDRMKEAEQTAVYDGGQQWSAPTPEAYHPAEKDPPFVDAERAPSPDPYYHQENQAQTQIYAAPAVDERQEPPAEWQPYPDDNSFYSAIAKPKKSKKGLIIGIIAGVLVIAIAVAAVFLVPKLLNKNKGDGSDGVEMQEQNRIAVGDYHTAVLQQDGTVTTAGDNENGQCDVSEWTDIAAVASGTYHTVGLKNDGTVVATTVKSEQFDEGQSKVESWQDITAIAAGQYHTVALKQNGTVIATGSNDDGQCDVSEWTDITAISAKGNFTVGLKSDGTVVAVGENDYGQCEVSEWTDIKAISAGKYHTVGLKNDGTVVCTAIGKDDNNKGQCEVSGWTDIKAVSAGKYHTVALKNDGTVLSTSMDEDDEENKGQCDISGWTDVTAICAGVRNTVALKSDGTVLAAGDGSYGLTEINDRKVN